MDFKLNTRLFSKGAVLVLLVLMMGTAYGQNINIQPARQSVRKMIAQIEKQSGITFVFSSRSPAIDRIITLSRPVADLRDILQQIGHQTNLTLTREGNQVIVKEKQTGTIRGDVRTSDGQPAGFVTVGIRGQRNTYTNEQGQFVLEHIEAGTHTILASYVGLQTLQQEVTVTAASSATVHFVLNENSHTLKEVVVTSKQGAYNQNMPSSSLRIQTPVLETPQSVILIGKQLLADQQALTMTDVTRNVSGVTTIFPYVGIYTDFNIRGTRASMNKLRNGMNTNGSGSLQEDMSYVENVEFIKGPAGFMLAQGEPGGMYNVVTKKPLGYEHLSATFTTGSYGLYRSAVDFGGNIGKDKKLSYRLNAMKQFSGTHLDYGLNNRLSIAPVLQYAIDDNTSLTVEYNLDVAKVNGSFAQVSTRNQQFLRRSFMVEDPVGDPMALTTHYGYINLQHQINAQWKLTAQIGGQYANQDGCVFYTTADIDAQGMLPRNYRYIARRSTIITGQVFVNGNVNTGNVGHKILLGIDGGVNTSKLKLTDALNILPINVDKPVYGLAAGIDTLIDKSIYPWRSPSKILWQAIALQDDIAITDWLQLTLGGRFTHYENGSSANVMKDDVFTPRAGLIIKPFPNTSIYALYDQSFVAQTGTDFFGNRFKPVTGNNFEVGLKREWFGSRLFTQLAAFNINKNNALTGDPDHLNFNIQRGQIRSRGIELDVIGAVTDNLNIVVNYAYTDSKITKDTKPEVVGQRGQAPTHAYNLWAKYSVNDGALKGLGLGFGGSYYQDQYGGWTTKKDPSDAEKLVDYKSLNAALYYQTGKLNFTLNVDNLTDEFNFLGSFNYKKGTSGEYTYLALPGINWRLSVGYGF